jgi:hypothetical protein
VIDGKLMPEVELGVRIEVFSQGDFHTATGLFEVDYRVRREVAGTVNMNRSCVSVAAERGEEIA